MASQTYSQKLLDPRWQKKRLQVLERDGWACISCSDKTNTLHVHHLWYEKGKEPWEIENSALVTLCADCHANETEVREHFERSLISALRRSTLNGRPLLADDVERLMSTLAEYLDFKADALFVCG